jgi:hypothetical protein
VLPRSTCGFVAALPCLAMLLLLPLMIGSYQRKMLHIKG